MKKVLSIILAVTLIFSCIAIPASALEANENTVTTACAHCFEKIGSFFKNIGNCFSDFFKSLIKSLLELFNSEPPTPIETTEPESSTEVESTTEIESTTDTETTTEEETTEPTTTRPLPYLVAKQDTITIDRESMIVYGFEELLRTDDVSDYVKVNDESIGELEIISIRQITSIYTGTGTIINVIDKLTGDIVESFRIVIFGDLDSDSCANGVDLSIVKDEALGSTSWSDKTSEDYRYYMLIAADLDKDGVITEKDQDLLNKHVLGLHYIDQVSGGNIIL